MHTRRALVALVVVSLMLLVAAQPAAAVTPNPITVENQQPGTTSWQFTNYNKAEAHQIEGYASLASVNKGGQISFMASLSSAAQYTIDVYRMGWYPTGTNPDGSSCAPSCGGRLMQHIGPLNGIKQTTCPTVTTTTDPNFGMTECNWPTAATITIPQSWTTGNYIAKLTRLDGTNLENYMTFVVRDDASTADVVYSLDVSTWQAYNFFGGRNLYGQFNDTTLASVGNSRAYTVSLNRPYLVQGSVDGAGLFMVWDFPLVRWMESKGYDMTYVTSGDLDANPNLLSGHRAFVNTGHDEYYSDGMRTAIKNGIAGGTNLALFSANNFFHRITWGADSTGAQSRRVHTDKGATSSSTTREWRYLTPPKPENEIGGVLLGGVATSRPFLVSDASHWIYAGAGLSTYTGNGTTGVVTSGAGQNALPGIVGYEFDTRASNDASLASYVPYDPPGIQQVGHSFVPAADNGVNAWTDAVLWTAPSGATVFSAGTLQWPFTLDDGFNDGFCSCGSNVASAAGKRVTSNILDRFVAPTNAPAVSTTPSSLSFAAQPVGTTSAAQALTVRNSGSGPLSIGSIGVSGANAGDFAQTTTCPLSPATLAAGASCTVSVSFAPTAGGTRSAALVLNDNAPGSPHSTPLTGTGTVRALTVTPSPVAFGAQRVGTTSAAQTATVRNTGTAPVTISSVGIAGTNAADFAQTGSCPLSPATLAAGGTCTLSVTFAPTAAGARSATLAVADDAPGSPHVATLTGTGTAPGASLTPSLLTFAGQIVGTTSASQSVTLQNTGTTALAIASIALTGANAADFQQAVDCGSTLAVGATCTISVSFGPTATGTRSASLVVADDAPDTPQSIPVSGTGTPPAPAVALSPTSLAFGSQRVDSASAAQTATLRNSGTASLHITDISLSGTNPGDFAQSNDCPATLAAGVTCTISARFAPTAAGARSARVVVTDDATDSPQSLAVAGTGTAPAASLTPSSVAFGSVLVGAASSPSAVTITNTGTAPLAFGTVPFTITGSEAGDFTQTSDCGATLAVNATCSVAVTFRPVASGSRTATLSASDDAPGAPQTVALTGSGMAPAPALTATPMSVDFGSQVTGRTSAARTVTLRNTGTGPLTFAVSPFAITGGNAGDFAQTSDCGATLAVDATCSVSVTFTPGTSGTRTAALGIADDAADSPQSVPLTGSGVPPAPAIALTPASVDFGSRLVGSTSSAATITVSNPGTASLSISSIAVAGSEAGDFARSSDCGPVLAVNASCTVSVTFTPGGTGARSGSIVITDAAAGSPHSVGLSGTGAAPAASLTPSSLSFTGQVGTTSAAQTVTLRNTGTATLNVSSIGFTGGNAGDFAQTSTCGATLAAGASCTVSVTFGPTAAGARSSTLAVGDDAPGSPHTVAVSGTASTGAPAVTLTPTSQAFSRQQIGVTSAAQTTTVRNSGTAPLTISGVALTGANAGDFSQTTTCPAAPATLAVGATCTIATTFRPAAAGARTAAISIADDAPASPQSVALTGTGVYFAEDFESATLSRWTIAGTGTATSQTAQKHAGAAAASLVATATQSISMWAPLSSAQTQTWTRFYFRWTGLTGVVPIAYGSDVNDKRLWEIDFRVQQRSPSVIVWNGAGTKTSFNTSSGSIPANQWHSIELRVNEATSGNVEIWVDGTSMAQRLPNLSVPLPYARLYLANSAGGSAFFDDVFVSSTYTGP